MENSLIYEMFKKYNTNHNTDLYLICPLCNKPFCNTFTGQGKKCTACRDKQMIQFGSIFCDSHEGNSTKPHCVCRQASTIDKNILILYLITLMDYIDNLEYKLVCKEERRDYG